MRLHLGSVVAVLAGFACGRVFGATAATLLGAASGHQRGADAAAGALLVALPLAALAGYRLVERLRPGLLFDRWMRAVLAAGWVLAGLVLGLLPWSRSGALTGLRHVEVHRAPGLVHGMDLAVAVALGVAVSLVVASRAARRARG